MTDRTMMELAGPDAIQYLRSPLLLLLLLLLLFCITTLSRFQQYLIFFVLLTTILCICVILPFNFQVTTPQLKTISTYTCKS